ncbi:globin [Corynebacterium diphtheriae]|uniref:globin n=1 Tax=Corynebacterium diphtheriae TaxID=1717 RepID=UPI0002467FC0|nr:globin [Corynebacterium diphtheriae]MCM0029575.1 globin [Corynebacterium diphtheriae bv. mitis]AEX72681.1 hemoglobin-like protein [Corynebacterium diphtheriae CDCE 8392]AEX79438.1 hemoglobin-like protein [Corynebacterium diphtheriae HC03]KJJ59192.1 group 2 hemoglobin GlbO [Corynebacterium diphtheriae]MBG9343164.1 globin [Corynebacterium diphtheriae]
MNTSASFYESVGGEETFHLIVHRFYERMRNDDLIGPMYPDDDWEGAEDRLRWFLAQYWGGPQTFSENRGHPRLRMRHAHFPIGMNEAQRWLDIMSDTLDSIDEATLPPAHRAAMWDHMQRVAQMLINQAP